MPWIGSSRAEAMSPGASRPAAGVPRRPRNTAWRAATSPLILFLDDDILPEPALVAEHLAWHRQHPEEEIGVLGERPLGGRAQGHSLSCAGSSRESSSTT